MLVDPLPLKIAVSQLPNPDALVQAPGVVSIVVPDPNSGNAVLEDAERYSLRTEEEWVAGMA